MKPLRPDIETYHWTRLLHKRTVKPIGHNGEPRGRTKTIYLEQVTFQISGGKMNWIFSYDVRPHASPWKNKMGFPAGQTPNLRDLQITTIYLVHVTVGQQFGLNSPQRLFFWSWMGSFIDIPTQLISWVGTSWFKITLLTPLEVGLLSARVMESNRPHASPHPAGLFTRWPNRVPREQVWRVS